MSEIYAIDPNRRTNSQLIADVARLGYLDGRVLDLTYNQGNFWNDFRPEGLVTNDLDEQFDTDFHWDFRQVPVADSKFDAVVLDPPYRLNGKPDLSFDKSYGISQRVSANDRIQLIKDGAVEACRISRAYVLVKCQAQVNAGRVVWQDRIVADTAESAGAKLVERFDLLSNPRPQPPGRRQVQARRNHSTLLIFQV